MHPPHHGLYLVLHLMARHHTHPKANLPPQAYAWVAPWCHHADANLTVAWNSDHKAQWLFATTPTSPAPTLQESQSVTAFTNRTERASTSTPDAFPWGGLATGRCADTHSQAGRQSTALTGASLRSCHETKRFRILATLKQGNKSMYSNTSGYVHTGLRLDWGKGITGQ